MYDSVLIEKMYCLRAKLEFWSDSYKIMLTIFIIWKL